MLAFEIVNEGFARDLQSFEGQLEKILSDYKVQARGMRKCGASLDVLHRRHHPCAWTLLRTIKRIRASDGCLGAGRR